VNYVEQQFFLRFGAGEIAVFLSIQAELAVE